MNTVSYHHGLCSLPPNVWRKCRSQHIQREMENHLTIMVSPLPVSIWYFFWPKRLKLSPLHMISSTHALIFYGWSHYADLASLTPMYYLSLPSSAWISVKNHHIRLISPFLRLECAQYVIHCIQYLLTCVFQLSLWKTITIDI